MSDGSPQYEIVGQWGFSIQRAEDGSYYAEDLDGNRLSDEQTEDFLDAFGFAGDMIRRGEL